MRIFGRFLFGVLLVIGVAACGDDGGPDESYACGDGTTLEVIRPDDPDPDGNVGRVRVTGGEVDEDLGRVSADDLASLIAACTGE